MHARLSRNTNEYYYWNGVRIETSRALQRLKRDLRWNAPALEGVSVDMQRSGVNRGPTTNEEFIEGEAHPPTVAREHRTRAPQNIAIRQADWLRHGGTTGCPKCIHARDNGWGRTGGAHSPACIERFRRALEATEEGKRKLADIETRRTGWLARQVEKADQNPDARGSNEPLRFDDLEEIEIPDQV